MQKSDVKFMYMYVCCLFITLGRRLTTILILFYITALIHELHHAKEFCFIVQVAPYMYIHMH